MDMVKWLICGSLISQCIKCSSRQLDTTQQIGVWLAKIYSDCAAPYARYTFLPERRVRVEIYNAVSSNEAIILVAADGRLYLIWFRVGAGRALWDDSWPDKIQIAAPPDRGWGGLGIYIGILCPTGRPETRPAPSTPIKGYDGYLCGQVLCER